MKPDTSKAFMLTIRLWITDPVFDPHLWGCFVAGGSEALENADGI